MIHVAIRQTLAVSVLAAASLFLSNAAFAVASSTYSYSFVGVTNTSSANTASGVASLAVEVIDLGYSSERQTDQVAFKFTNASSSSLTDVYFDDGTLLGIASITDSGNDVAFSDQGVAPPSLPGGENLNPDFITTAGFSADSNPPVILNGVTSGEWLTIIFDLKSGQTYASVLNALALPNNGGTGDLRIGLHVQSFSNGGSESFVNSPDGVASPVPEAQTTAMMLAGLGLVGFMNARRCKV